MKSEGRRVDDLFPRIHHRLTSALITYALSDVGLIRILRILAPYLYVVRDTQLFEPYHTLHVFAHWTSIVKRSRRRRRYIIE